MIAAGVPSTICDLPMDAFGGPPREEFSPLSVGYATASDWIGVGLILK